MSQAGITSVAGSIGIPVTVPNGGTGRSSLTAHGFLIGNGTSPVTVTAAPTNGQIPIGSTGLDPVLATITAGAGISVTNAAGSITIAASGTGFTWNTVAGTTQTIAVQNGYINGNAAATTFTLPATAAVGDTFQIAGYGAGGWVIAQNANQKIYLGSSTTTVGVGGSLASTNAHDTIEIMCIVANLEFQALDVIGNITVV